jgi:hypothetical protein
MLNFKNLSLNFKNMLKKILLIPIAIVVAGAIIAGAIIYLNQGNVSGSLPPQEAAEKAINYINQNMVAEGMTASLVNVTEENGVYKIRLKVGENEYDSYVTKNGKVFFIEGIDMEPASQAEGEETVEVTKKDIPEVKIFVMSYCPYGLQAQKMFLPVYDLLKDKADLGVYFVDYIMHEKKEIDENLRQYCIQKEEKEKYYNYLSCFVVDGKFDECLTEAKVDKTKIATCISETDEEYNITSQYNDEGTWLNGQYPKFDVQGDLNDKYEVQGSPTIVINDEVVNISSRSPESFKESICQAFTTPPSECSQTLSDEVPSPGLGLGTTSSNGGSCE